LCEIRIIKQVKNNGDEVYIPQYCSFFFWRDFRQSLAPEHIEVVKYKNFSDANSYIEDYKQELKQKRDDKIISKTVVMEFK